ncbi:MAG: hypothetical protein KBS82_05130 [Oscillospiraceae bacterium]|nr:hypothetical protein [Candidatus Limimonas egerieequi]
MDNKYISLKLLNAIVDAGYERVLEDIKKSDNADEIEVLIQLKGNLSFMKRYVNDCLPKYAIEINE